MKMIKINFLSCKRFLVSGAFGGFLPLCKRNWGGSPSPPNLFPAIFQLLGLSVKVKAFKEPYRPELCFSARGFVIIPLLAEGISPQGSGAKWMSKKQGTGFSVPVGLPGHTASRRTPLAKGCRRWGKKSNHRASFACTAGPLQPHRALCQRSSSRKEKIHLSLCEKHHSHTKLSVAKLQFLDQKKANIELGFFFFLSLSQVREGDSLS